MKNEVSIETLQQAVELPKNYVVLDTETTGLKAGYDEVLSISIVDPDGNVLFDSLIQPTERKKWPNASKIHGIRYADVKDKPTLREVQDEVMKILNGADVVVGYNVSFDLDMLHGNGLPTNGLKSYDLMGAFSQAYGTYNEQFKNYDYVKLGNCADHYGYTFGAHNALEDAKATAYCLREFQRECADELPRAREAQEKKLAQQKTMRMVIICVVAALVIAGIIVAIVNPTLFWGVLLVAVIVLWMAYKMLVKPNIR